MPWSERKATSAVSGQHFVVKLLFAANGIGLQKGHVKERKGRFRFFYQDEKNDIRKVFEFRSSECKVATFMEFMASFYLSTDYTTNEL